MHIRILSQFPPPLNYTADCYLNTAWRVSSDSVLRQLETKIETFHLFTFFALKEQP